MCLLLPYTLYSAALLQAYGIMFVWADTAVNRVVLGWQVPVTWIGIVDGLLTILGVILANRIWIRLAARGREPSDFAKMAIGYAGVAAAFLLAGAIATLPLVPVMLWIAFFVVLDFSIGWVEPPTQSLVSRDSPRSINATMMAILKASTMFSYFFLGWLGRFYEPLGAALYWTATAALPAAALLLVLLFRTRVMALLEPQERPVATGGGAAAAESA
jgi:POT family proton-dependent oligopeptide transporter